MCVVMPLHEWATGSLPIINKKEMLVLFSCAPENSQGRCASDQLSFAVVYEILFFLSKTYYLVIVR